MLNIREIVNGYNYTARTYAELVPYMFLWDDSTVTCVDHGVMSMYQYQGLDAEGKSDTEKEVAVKTFERAFAGFGSGVTVWTYVDRRKTDRYPTGHFEDPVARMVDGVWKEVLTTDQYENRYTMAVHQRAQSGSMALFDAADLIIKEEGVGLMPALMRAAKANLSLKARASLDERKITSSKRRLDEVTDVLETSLKSLGLEKLKGEKLLAELHNRVNFATPRRETYPMPSVPCFLSNILVADGLRRQSDCLIFENGVKKYVGVISLKGFSGESETVLGQLDWLTDISGEVSVSHCFRFIDRDVAEKVVDEIERYNISKSVPFMHRLMTSLAKKEPTKFNEGRLALAESAREAKQDIYINNRAFGYHNLTILCFGDTPDEMKAVRQQILESLRHSRFSGHTERMHQLSAFTQTIPGQWAAGVRWNFVSYGNAADIAPIRTIVRGPDNCGHFERELQRPFPVFLNAPTTSGSPVSLDLWENGVGHMKVIGPTRSGKSTITNFLLTLFKKYEPCRTIIIDKNYSCKVMTVLQDGVHIDLNRTNTGGARMAPLSLLESERHIPFLVNWFIEMVELGRSTKCTPTEIEKITSSLHGMRQLDRSYWRIESLIPSLGPDLGRYLARWANGSSDGNWFDNEPLPMESGRHVCFECKDLFNDKAVASLSMSYLFYLIEELLDDTPTIVSIEETWFFLDNERFAKKIDDFLRTLGKRNAALWIVTQNAKEIDDSPIRNSIIANIPNTMFLADRRIRENSELYINAMGLLQEEIDLICEAQEKRHYYIKTASVSRMLDMSLPEEIVVVLSSGSRARATLEKYYAQRHENEDWKSHYFKEMMHA